MSAGQDREVLQNNGVEQRSHQLIGRDALLLQAVDIGFREDTAFACDRMQLDAGVALVAEFFGWNLELRVDLVDDGARTSRALVVHRRDFFLAAGIPVFLENDDFGILPAQFNDRVHLGVQLFDRQ